MRLLRSSEDGELGRYEYWYVGGMGSDNMRVRTLIECWVVRAGILELDCLLSHPVMSDSV